MASPNKGSEPPSANNDNENPFIAFRRYADEQMSSVLQSFVGLPSALKFPSSNTSWLPNDEEARRRRAENQDYSDVAEDSELRNARKADEETSLLYIALKALAEEDDQEMAENPLKMLAESTSSQTEHKQPRCPYRPAGQLVPERNKPKLCHLLDVRNSDFAALIDDALTQTGVDVNEFSVVLPLSYIMRSPYSPLQLEQHELMSLYGKQWRDAFEDLMAVQSGQKMRNDSLRRDDCTRDEWICSMLKGGMFGRFKDDAEKGLGETTAWNSLLGTLQPKNDTKEDEVTELDLYERFLGTQYPPSSSDFTTGRTSPEASLPSSQLTPNCAVESEKPSILSTLTTTERRILPDGSVHTKVLLKKRFSDGAEESTETVHKSQGHLNEIKSRSQSNPHNPAVPLIGNDGANVKGADASREEKGKKGWFWS
ncbi:hypothetical protein MMC12_002247 [Toensbergia leucococca]|nr:hypothetical protein [Toensbergia leucococca]